MAGGRCWAANLAAFAVVVLVIAIWTTDRAVLIPAVIISGIFIGVNNTVTTQAVMTVSPVEKPVASAAYSFVRFIGGGLAPYAAGRMVLAVNIHFPFYIAVGAILIGIGILTTAHGLLTQAEQVTGSLPAASAAPAGALIPVEGSAEPAPPGASVILAAVDGSPVGALVTEAAATLAADQGGVVHVVHTQEEATAGDVAIDGESLDAARAMVLHHLDRLAAHRVGRGPDPAARGRPWRRRADDRRVRRHHRGHHHSGGRVQPQRAARPDGRQRQP